MNIIEIRALLEANTLFTRYSLWELDAAEAVVTELAAKLVAASKVATPAELTAIRALCHQHAIDFDEIVS